MVENSLKRRNELKEELKALENRKQYLEAVYSNAEELESMYMHVRADMRTKNIGALSILLNEMFNFMYTNNAYSHIELDPEYNLTVIEKTAPPLNQNSLAEENVQSLTLSCAVRSTGFLLWVLAEIGQTGFPP